ncbi:MAG: uracil-DNA glycosylase family protein [Burkholderiaceae bacterium]
MDDQKQKVWTALGLGPVFELKPAQSSADHLPPDVHAAHTVAAMDWIQLHDTVKPCTLCGLGATRTQTVFEAGQRTAHVMIVGEAPGADEDACGEPFVGQAGKLLDQMLRAIGQSRQSNVYIANVLKCRPPGNRNPAPDEVMRCAPYLQRQIELVQPSVLFLVGKFAIHEILKTDATVGSLRGKVHLAQIGSWQGPAVVSYHPAYLLRSLPEKHKSWEDLLLLKKTLQAGVYSNTDSTS